MMDDDWRWVVAIEAADSWGDLQPLAECLRGTDSISADVREMLADLFEVRSLSPDYPLSPQQEWLIAAAYHYELLRKSGQGKDAAITRLAREYAIPEEKLREFIDGRGYSAQSMRRRRKR